MGLFPFRSAYPLLVGLAAISNAAKLIPVQAPPKITPAFEQNKGQTAPEILFVSRNPGPNVAITATSIISSPLRGVLELRGANPTPLLRLPAPLPGVSHYYSGADASKWVRDVPRYASFELVDVWPKIDVEYVVGPDSVLSRITCRPGCDLNNLRYEVRNVHNVALEASGDLVVMFGLSRIEPYRYIPAPKARQNGTNVNAAYVSNVSKGLASFGFKVTGYDPTLPLVLEFNAGTMSSLGTTPAADIPFADGSRVVAANIHDSAKLEAPLPGQAYLGGCGAEVGAPIACSDINLSRFTAAGELEWVTYLGGRFTDQLLRVHSSKSGLWIVGNTQSPDLPVTVDALQRTYAGPARTQLATSAAQLAGGDYFVLKVDSRSGALMSGTYFGGGEIDTVGSSYLAPDDSLYVVSGGPSAKSLPTTSGTIRPACESGCSAHAVRLDATLSKVIYATYLPGSVRDTDLHSDGSLIFAGYSPAGFPVTPNAYRSQPSGEVDGTVARLDPTGRTLKYATYLGSDALFVGADAQDGAWVSTAGALLHLNATGSNVLFSKPIQTSKPMIDVAGNVHLTSTSGIPPTPDALIAHSCDGPQYLKLSASGDVLTASYLPRSLSSGYPNPIQRLSEVGDPVFEGRGATFQLSNADSTQPFAGCVVNAARLRDTGKVAPGSMVAIFGNGLGPRNPVAFELQDNRLPTLLGGTRVVLNGVRIPLLYSSYSQVNAVLPYSLPQFFELTVEFQGVKSDWTAPAERVKADFSFFTMDGSGSGQAAAINQDGTINSAANPAKAGSVITLYGTGGGSTVPPGRAGEITPVELRRLESSVSITLGESNRLQPLSIEFAGAAPALLTGIDQINVRLPNPLPAIPNKRAAALYVLGASGTQPVTIAVE